MTDAPVDNLVRAWASPEAIAMRSDGDTAGNTLHGHFAVFDTPTEINSMYEGRFVERIAPGAFADTIADRGDQIKVLFDHGHDPSIGNKPLGRITSLTEDKRGAAYEVDLFDVSYVDDLKPALRANQLGASFRFRVDAERWDESPKPSTSNPAGLPERTIERATVFEFGPVTFPAYADATAGLRSTTDQFAGWLLHDPEFLARFTDRVGLTIVEQLLASLPGDLRSGSPTDTAAGDAPADEVTTTNDFGARASWLMERRLPLRSN